VFGLLGVVGSNLKESYFFLFFKNQILKDVSFGFLEMAPKLFCFLEIKS
jgi:hypothetical protein